MTYWERVREIQHLQWELFKDYWPETLCVILVGLLIYGSYNFWVLYRITRYYRR